MLVFAVRVGIDIPGGFEGLPGAFGGL